MAKSQIKIQAPQEVWYGGFTLDDFLPQTTAPAQPVIQDVTIDLQYATSGMSKSDNSPELVDEAQVDFTQTLLAALADWQKTDDDLGCAVRKTMWPQLNAGQYRPETTDRSRVEGNLDAIRMLAQLKVQNGVPDESQTATLMRYCGWGGLARMLGPKETLPNDMQSLRDDLENLTTDDELKSIISSVNSAFFTEPDLVASIWKLLGHLGFKGGRICEPAGGVGHFIMGMPRDVALKSDISVVELDKISSQILETCFAPHGVQVHSCGLEKAKIPHEFFDLVVGNVPFGQYRTNDTNRAPYSDWKIHNWFIAKSIELVRPGGLVAVICSRHFLDSKTTVRREWIAHRAELVGALRLPTMTFEAFAGTEAVTDLLVFKRRDMPDFTANPFWIKTVDAPRELMAMGQANWKYSKYGSNRETQRINAYYVQHQQAVIGKLEWKHTQFGEDALPVFSGTMPELIESIDQTVGALMASDQYKARASESGESLPLSFIRHRNVTSAQPGAFVLSQGSICISEGEELLDVNHAYSGTTRKRLLGMMDIRDKAAQVIEHQATSDDDAVLKHLQSELNHLYDNFVAQFGALRTSANARVMRSDPGWPVMLALEVWDDEEQKATKADIFFKRTVGSVDVPTHVESAKDAMLISLALYGKIVLKDMAVRTGKPVMEVVNELKANAVAYRDPELAKWVPADEYLSGNIKNKIVAAKAAGPAYDNNVLALTNVLPSDLGPAEVEARLGATWIPVSVIREFAEQLVKINPAYSNLNVGYDSATATWSLSGGYCKLEYMGERSAQTIQWGTSRRCALELLQGALNQQPPTVHDTVDGRQVVNSKATLEARGKWQAIRDHFHQWVYADDARRDMLLRIYNDTFNQIVPRNFDGAHLHLPGMSLVVTPYAHQKNAIWRILVNGNTLLAHAVGAGKTLEMIAASMEMKRLGKASKPLHVVLNHCLEQYVSEALRLYPQAKVLMATKNDLSGDKRRTFVARVATGDWDMVVMTQSTFERLALSPDEQRRFIDQQMQELREALSLTKDGGSKRSIKEMEKRLKEHEAKLVRNVEKDGDNAVYFDHLGVDALFLDEAHAYKNLGKASKMPRIAGLPNTASNRAFDVFMKTRVIMEKRGGAQENVIFATATPITNSLAEMHTMQLFLQPKTLKRYGIHEFDAWSANFGEAVTGMELAPDGSGFRTNTRYARFTNLPELMAIFKQVADIKTKAMLKLPTPEIFGGGPQTMVVKASDPLKDLTQTLVERAEKIRAGSVDPKDDNMLAVTNDGRRAALDIRLVMPTMQAEPGCKLEVAANNIYRIWEEGASKRLTQLVFSDIGAPGAIGFSVYDDLRERLVNLGVPKGDIAFIHDYESDTAKANLFKKVRDGMIRILFGSTQKLGTGTNVQTRLCAVHQLDAPWRPSDVEQRDGRADRQGNMCESIGLWRYVTEGSFDAYSWQVLAVKAKFIDQVMTAEQGLRTMEDIGSTALSYAEIKAIASGNPLVLEKATVDSVVQKLSLSLSHWEQDRWRTGRQLTELKTRMAYITSVLPLAQLDSDMAKAVINTKFEATGSLLQGAIASVDEEQAIGAAFKAAAGQKHDCQIGRVGEFELFCKIAWNRVELEVIAPNSGLMRVADRPNMGDLKGVTESAKRAINMFATMPDKLKAEYASKEREVQSCEIFLTADFEHREELNKALKRQMEIEASLDLYKDTEGSQAVEDSSQ